MWHVAKTWKEHLKHVPHWRKYAPGNTTVFVFVFVVLVVTKTEKMSWSLHCLMSFIADTVACRELHVRLWKCISIVNLHSLWSKPLRKVFFFKPIKHLCTTQLSWGQYWGEGSERWRDQRDRASSSMWGIIHSCLTDGWVWHFTYDLLIHRPRKQATVTAA